MSTLTGQYSIANTCLPRQMNTQKAVTNPREYAPDEWAFEPTRAQEYDWQPTNRETSSLNMRAKNEGYQTIKSGMFAQNRPENPIYGHVKYFLNPLDQEQCNAKMSGYQLQKQTRVSNNMSPDYSMRQPYYQYGVNYPANVWSNFYENSQRLRAPFPKNL